LKRPDFSGRWLKWVKIMERVQKLIAAAGLASRREAERWIEQGRVTVNGHPAKLGERADPARDRIEVDGNLLAAAEEHVYLMLHKPTGYVTTAKDPEGRPTVLSLVRNTRARVYPVGRLDLNSEGLLLLTNDGELANRLMHPRHQVAKTYQVKVRGHLTPEAQVQLEEGVPLEDGPSAPASVANVRETRSHTWFELTIYEGRNRVVRRMCETLGYQVARLLRTRIDFLQLGDLRPGQCRPLSDAEVKRLKEL